MMVQDDFSCEDDENDNKGSKDFVDRFQESFGELSGDVWKKTHLNVGCWVACLTFRWIIIWSAFGINFTFFISI